MDVVAVADLRLIDGVLAAEFKEGYYATLDGRLWSFWRCLGPKHGNINVVRFDVDPRLLKTKINGTLGYRANHLGYVHRNVWTAWRNDPGELQVRHLDRDPSNNALDNLALGTQQENEADKIRHGTKQFGDIHVNSKLTTDLVIAARKLWTQWYGVDEIIECLDLDINRNSLYGALVGATWKHVDAIEPPRPAVHWTQNPRHRTKRGWKIESVG